MKRENIIKYFIYKRKRYIKKNYKREIIDSIVE